MTRPTSLNLNQWGCRDLNTGYRQFVFQPQGGILDQPILQPQHIRYRITKLIYMVYETIVGRIKEDREKFGNKCVGYIGKHIVGTGEDAHLTTKVLIDLLRPHVILVSGKRGSGKSYSAAVILEEFCLLPEEFKKNLAFVVVDPMGIYWSMKYSNEVQSELLRRWDLEPKALKDYIRTFVPEKQKEEYLLAGIPIDGTITIALKEFTAEDLILSFGLKRTEEMSIALEKSFNILLESQQDFGFEELIDKIKDDREVRKEVKDALTSLLTVANQWGLISKEGIKIEELVKPGTVTIIDLSRMISSELRSLLTALLTRKIYFNRVLARKEEERIKIEGGEAILTFPVTWIVLEEAHNYIPSDREVASSEPIKRLAKEGREPGIGLITITQMPNKVHQDVLSQTDLVISFRLTSRDDLDALHSVMQTYMQETLEKLINSLPRWTGSALILDDNLEKIFTVQIRPRFSHHAGGTAIV